MLKIMSSATEKYCAIIVLLGSLTFADVQAANGRLDSMIDSAALSLGEDPDEYRSMFKVKQDKEFKASIERFSLPLTEVQRSAAPAEFEKYAESLEEVRVVTLNSILEGCCKANPQNEDYYRRLQVAALNCDKGTEFLFEEFRRFVYELPYGKVRKMKRLECKLFVKH